MIFKGKFKDHPMVTWIINSICNFHCDYCIQWHNKKAVKPVDIHRLSGFLSYLEKDWIFHITGGEPFLEKNLISICKRITENHYLGLNSNLSLNKVYDFAERINPEKVLFISAAVHIEEREKRDKKLKSFISKIISLQKKGFNIIANYVAYPSLFNRIEKDIRYLKQNGIEKVRVKIYRGLFNGKFYPSAYNPSEREFLTGFETEYPEIEILNRKHSYYGLQCNAGRKFFIMDRSGNLKRCSSSRKSYGNLFDQTIKIDESPLPCPVNYCYCCYEGIRNVTDTKAERLSVMKEDILEKSLKIGYVIRHPEKLKGLKTKAIQYFSVKKSG